MFKTVIQRSAKALMWVTLTSVRLKIWSKCHLQAEYQVVWYCSRSELNQWPLKGKSQLTFYQKIQTGKIK